MSTASPGAGRGSRGSVVILGADAFLAALPATPTQLANACFAAGYDDVVPASWGDELLAVGCLDQLAARDDGPTVACICPLVREQLRGANGLAGATVRLVSPPVAAALYLRATAGETQPRITYVGDCPGAGHPSIDIHLSPVQFQALLAERGIVPGSQRPVTTDRAPRDRRRHYSLPGGVPAPQWLGSEGIGRTLVDLGELSALDAGALRTFVDLAPRLGCVCSGALAGGAAAQARGAVMALEPPRSNDEIVNHAITVAIGTDTPAHTAPHMADREVSWSDFVSALAGVWSGGSPAPVPMMRLPTSSRPPVNRPRVPKRLGQEGRVLPRAYQMPQAHDGVSGRVRARATRRAERDLVPRPTTRREESPVAAAPSAAAAAHQARPTQASPSRVTAARHTRTALASTDRWLLIGLAIAGSVVVAVLTSVMTVRGLRRPASAIAAGAARETVFVTAPGTPRVATSATAPQPSASAPVPAPAPARPVQTARADTPSENVAAGSLRMDSAAHQAPKAVKLAEHSSSPPARAHAPVPVHERTRRAGATTDSPRRSGGGAARPNAPSAVVARAAATSNASSRGVPTGAPDTPVPLPKTPPAPASPPSPTATASPSVAAPARDSAAQSNAEVLTELRAIRNEIESRKRHVDSLTRALDSLGTPRPPR